MHTTPDSPSAPNWATLPDEALCPLCDYNLRGLLEPRCPECGYTFAWNEVLDPALRRHPYLFEHHPRRGFWSFWRTLAGSLLPRRFWRSLRPSQPSNLKRLLLYWALIACACCLPLLTLIIPVNPRRIWQPSPYWSLRSTLYYRSISSEWGQLAQPFLRGSLVHLLLMTVAAALLWPPVTFALLMTFQASMHKARIKVNHVLRCVVYSADAMFWIAPPLAAGTWAAALYSGRITTTEWACWACLAIAPATYLLLTYRLAVAYRLYLRFQHPTATVLATQFIVILFMLVLLAGASAGWFGRFY